MKSTIANLLSMAQMERAVVVAGAKGTSNEIAGVIFIEFPPSIKDAKFLDRQTVFKEKNCILLSSLYAVSHDVDEQISAFTAFAKGGSCGMLLFHVGHIIEKIDERVINLCNELNYPLIVTPPEMLFGEAHKVILKLIADDEIRRLEYAEKIYVEMTKLLLDGKSACEIVRTLAKMINRKTYFYDYNLTCKAFSDSQDAQLDRYVHDNLLLKPQVIANSHEPILLPYREGNEIALISVAGPVAFFGMIVVEGASDFCELDKIALSQAKNAIAIVSFNKINARNYNELLIRDLLGELISSDSIPDDVIMQRGKALGISPSKICRVAAVKILSGTQDISQDERLSIQDTIKSVASGASNVVVSTIMNDINLVFFSNEATNIKKSIGLTCQRIISAVKKIRSTGIYIGIGSYADGPSDLSGSYHDALVAANTSEWFSDFSQYVFYDDMCLYANLLKNPQLQGFVVAAISLLQPLVDYDEANDTELVKTLEVLLECNMSVSAASEKLFVHKNTMLQRKKKINLLLNENVFEAPFRLQYEMALMFLKLKKTP